MAQDPVCGMTVDEGSGISTEYQGVRVFFCSPLCKAAFDKQPGRYTKAIVATVGPDLGTEPRIAYYSVATIDPNLPSGAEL